MSGDMRTDACPSPPRDKPEEVVTENDDFRKPPAEEIPRKQPSSTYKKNQKRTKPPHAFANIIQISNANGVQVGSNYTIIVDGAKKGDDKKETVKSKQVIMLMQSTEPVTPTHISFVSKHIGEGWRTVGRALDYSTGQLDQFHADNYAAGLREVIYRLLLDWTRTQPATAKLARLANVLWDSEQEDATIRLANEVFP